MTLTLLQWFTLLLMGVALLLTLARFLSGPSVADRIVAADTLAGITIALLTLLSLLFGSALYLDLALLLGVLAFVGVVALAKAVLSPLEPATGERE